MSDDIDSELSAAKYALRNGLSSNYLTGSVPLFQIESLLGTIFDSPSEDTNLRQIDYPVYVNTDEHLTVTEGAAKLLQDVSNGPLTSDDVKSIIFPLLNVHHSKKLRIEKPLLKSDHASDFRAFAIWEDPHYIDGPLPTEPLDDEMDLSLEWPESAKKLPAELLKKLRSEKVEMSRETLKYLQAAIKGSWTGEDERNSWDSTIEYKRNNALEPVTPPLIRLNSPYSPYIASSPACHLPLLSDPASLISEDLQFAENLIFGQETLLPPEDYKPPISSTILSNYNNTKPSDVYSPLKFLATDENSLEEPHIKGENRKVEVPLTPEAPVSIYPMPVNIVNVVEEMLFDHVAIKKEIEFSLIGSEEEGDKIFLEAFEKAANDGKRGIEQEQLQEADSKHRVGIPIMDFSLPEPPWKLLPHEKGFSRPTRIQNSSVEEIKEMCKTLSIWPGISKLVPKLRWSIFPSEFAKAVLDESFGDDQLLHTILEGSLNENVIDSSGETWKRPGLRVLRQEDDDDDEDDLELASFDSAEPQDVLSLARKRKRMFDEEISTMPDLKSAIAGRGQAIESPAELQGIEGERDQTMVDAENSKNINIAASSRNLDPLRKKPATERQSNLGLLFDGPFSATDALENFLETRASKRQKAIESVYFAKDSAAKQSSEPALHAPSTQAVPPKVSGVALGPLPSPAVEVSTTPIAYLISSAILKQRGLIRSLGSLFPSALPIERDFTAYNTTAWIPNSISRSPITSALASEADLIISPSTGIILTTLQKIKQRPLPGQTTKSALKERIEKVSVRYERLIVLVSEGCSDESTNGLAEQDTLALAEFIGFCGSLDVYSIVHFVGGGEVTLSKWLVAAMAQHCAQGDMSIPLLQDETTWELFLRRAGFNAYAAQAIIFKLKAPDGVKEHSKPGIFGLSAFVEMDHEEKVRRFEDLLGGRRVLQRVGSVLDADLSELGGG